MAENRNAPVEEPAGIEPYKAYIDHLHKEIEELKIKVIDLEDDVEIYKEAIVNAFLKWSDEV